MNPIKLLTKYSPPQTMTVQWKRSIMMPQKINNRKSIIFQKYSTHHEQSVCLNQSVTGRVLHVRLIVRVDFLPMPNVEQTVCWFQNGKYLLWRPLKRMPAPSPKIVSLRPDHSLIYTNIALSSYQFFKVNKFVVVKRRGSVAIVLHMR